ncbi:His Kinase A (phospho-acceptor) domain-containing protein [Clostridium sp. DSM 8431]|uniref:sensor histidine kinase n=1 Tax=Clostridium sp. DSM 8431 TaxID=1761781 RepID=UPI0008EF62A5|nr:HAMP domain-containing sensor histidine kinase [Clostridium sp. DSM 8431]SFU54206.1 His Kinase A (phospho-acceptor) domain-containing protein [Clostridium sp. DSM 8431]
MFKFKSKFEVKEYLKNHAILFALTILLYAYFFSLFFEKNISIYIFLNEGLCACVAFSIGLICFLNRELKEGQFYKNMGACFFAISIISFCYIFIYRDSIFATSEVNVNENFIKANYCLEYLVIFVSYILSKMKKRVKYQLLVAIVVPVLLVVFLFLFYALDNISSFYLISKVILISILVLDIFAIVQNDMKLSKSEIKTLYLYIVLISFYQIIKSMQWEVGDIVIIIAFATKFISYYIIFSLISKFVIKQSYNNMEKEFSDIQITQKELNNILKSRNKTLIELEHIIEKSSKKYSDLIEHISDGIVIFYFDKIYYINSEAKRFFRNSEKNIHDISFDDFIELLLSKNKITSKYDMLKKDIQDIKDSKKDSYRFNLDSYCERQFEIYLFNIDNITKFAYWKDVTEINKNYEFKRKYKEYLRIEEAKKEFYSNISHELRTPINLIYSALQLSEINLNDDRIENLDKHNDSIKHNCLRLIRTINNFIDANKISEGYLEPCKKVHNIVSVVENISLACDRYMKKIENELIFDSEEEEYYVECDKEMIERVILNILSNSMKFGKNGGMTNVEINADYNNVIIHIKNNGYIVSEEERPYIFDKFTKINKSLNRSNEGSGLGLYLSKALLELNKGSIRLECNEDIGTEFIITLPRCYRIDECEIEEQFEMIDQLSEKVDIEFADIYI